MELLKTELLQSSAKLFTHVAAAATCWSHVTVHKLHGLLLPGLPGGRPLRSQLLLHLRWPEVAAAAGAELQAGAP